MHNFRIKYIFYILRKIIFQIVNSLFLTLPNPTFKLKSPIHTNEHLASLINQMAFTNLNEILRKGKIHVSR